MITKWMGPKLGFQIVEQSQKNILELVFLEALFINFSYIAMPGLGVCLSPATEESKANRRLQFTIKRATLMYSF